MIKHVVCFKLKNSGLIEKWQKDSAMLRKIETVQNFEASPLVKQDRYHCALYMEFAGEKELEIYQLHEIHQRYLKDVVPGLVEDKLVIDLKG